MQVRLNGCAWVITSSGVWVNNSELKYGPEHIVGVTSKGTFAPTKAQTIDIDLKPYKLVNNGDFVYNPSRFNIGFYCLSHTRLLYCFSPLRRI